eukprot:TRINITY_DN6946_c0_g1_i3.p1 TRINITY_DN6946_c0_g1~~TRINITY_DN6946_c0_g1_i3.p1  ORF type:complete len:399 (+),score=63.61 TRINITY_DN6946_c0_g1_i3:104-1300(+)
MDTLCPQAYGGGDYHQVGRLLQRGLMVSTFVAIPISIFWWFSGDVFILLGQDEAISRLAENFLRGMIPCVFTVLYSQSLVKYLSAQYIVVPVLIFNMIACVLAILSSYISIDVMGYGVAAAPVGVNVGNLCYLLLLVTYCWCHESRKKLWPGWSMEVFQDLWEFTKLGMSSMFMMCAEWWAFEIVVIFSGWISVEGLASMSIIQNTWYFTYMIPYGISIAAGSRVGNELGAKNPMNARRSAWISLIFILPVVLVVSLLLLFFSVPWVRLWNEDPKVLALCASVFPLVALQPISDSAQCVSTGVLRGLGKVNLGAMVNLVIFYLIGIPISFFLGIYYKTGLFGITVGLVVSPFLQAIVFVSSIILIDWEAQVSFYENENLLTVADNVEDLDHELSDHDG